IWASGTTHQISAVADQTGSNGRRYVFRNWSNNGAAAQTINVDQSTVDSAVTLVANYDLLSRVVVQSNPSGLSVQTDGATCQTPCILDRANGAQVRVSAPATFPNGDGIRLDLTGWSDGSSSDH